MKNIEIIKKGTELYDDETDEITGETVTTQLFTGRELAKFAGARSVWWEGDEDGE